MRLIPEQQREGGYEVASPRVGTKKVDTTIHRTKSRIVKMMLFAALNLGGNPSCQQENIQRSEEENPREREARAKKELEQKEWEQLKESKRQELPKTLERYKVEYNQLDKSQQDLLTWKDLEARLRENDSDLLLRAHQLGAKGVLFLINLENNGRDVVAYFADAGDQLVDVGLPYAQASKSAYQKGYSLFDHSLVRPFEEVTGKPFAKAGEYAWLEDTGDRDYLVEGRNNPMNRSNILEYGCITERGFKPGCFVVEQPIRNTKIGTRRVLKIVFEAHGPVAE